MGILGTSLITAKSIVFVYFPRMSQDLRGAGAAVHDSERALLRPQSHIDAADRSRDVRAAGVRQRPQATGGRVVLAASAAADALARDHRLHRVRRQRAQLLRVPAG